MNHSEYPLINQLLDRYYAGLATTEQTAQLLALLNTHPNLSDDLKKELRVIEAIESTGRQIDIPEDIDTRLISAIDKISASKIKPRRHILNYFTIGSAACLLLCAGITASYMLTREPESRYHVVTDPEETIHYIAYADQQLTDCFQKARQASQQAESNIDKVFNKISKHLNQQ